MTHRDIITLAKFKGMGFKNINLKYIPEIKLNQLVCSIDVKVGKGTYTLDFDVYDSPKPKIPLSRHYLFEQAIKSLQEFNSLTYKEKIEQLEKRENNG